MPTLLPIQALRALAALSVVACHFDQLRSFLAGRANDPQPLFNLSAGVDVFFVISGFIMVYSSEGLFGQPGGSYEFIIRRVARIVPAYWVTTAISIWLTGPPIDWQGVLGSYLFIPYRHPSTNIVPLHGVGWTLNFEMFFYAVFAVAIIWPRKIAIPGVCVVLCCIVVAGHWLQPQFVPFLFWSDPIILEFAAGVLIAVGHRSGIHVPIVLRGCIIGGALFTIWYVPQHMPPSGYRFLVWGLPAAALVACAVLGRRGVPSSRWLSGPIKLFGDASYALYLIHPLIGRLFFSYGLKV